MARDKTLLPDSEVAAFLEAHPGWGREGEATITRTYEFKAFLEGIRFVGRVAEAAEKADHHPDIDIRWRQVKLALTTHDAGGITFRDTALAAECDKLSSA